MSTKSNWELGKEISGYHFDTDEPDDNAFQICGRFNGDWKQELQEAYKTMKPVTWENRWTEYGKTDPRGNLTEHEHNDLINVGANPDQVLYQGSLTFGPTMMKMVDTLGMADARQKLHIQNTGESVVMHFDKHYDYPDPDNTRRFLIALEDWQPGQFIIFGNKQCDKWKAGDIITFDWQNIPHATANASFYNRPLLQVTGTMTEKTRDILRNEPGTVYDI